MSITGCIIIGIVIFFLIVFYIILVISYLGTSKGYKEAMRTNAIILEDLGDMRLATGSHVIGSPRFRIFHKYKVCYYVEGIERFDEVELQSRKRKVGDWVEVRYNFLLNGTISLESEAFLCWIREMVIGYTLGLILGIILSILKVNGYIS